MKSTVVTKILEVQGTDPRPDGPGRRLLVLEPDAVGEVLHSRDFQRTDFVRQLAGNGLLATDGTLWRERRRHLQPAFPPREPDFHRSMIEEIASTLHADLDAAVSDGEPRCLVDLLMGFVGRVVYRTVFGIDVPGTENPTRTFYAMMEAVGAVHWSLVAPNALLDPSSLASLQSTRAEADEEIDRVVAKRREGPTGGEDALGRMLVEVDAGRLEASAVRDELRSLVLAGTETSANSLAWAFLLLDGATDVRAQVEGLLDEGHDEGGALVTRILMETLRLFPPVWANERQAIQSTTDGGRTWEEGDRAVISSYRLHRDPAHWPRPDDFDPDRFRPSDGQAWRPPHRFAFMPFGAGPHLCLGRHLALAEMQVALRLVLSGFRLEFLAPDEVVPILGIVLGPSRPLMVRVARREGSKSETIRGENESR